MQLTRTKTFSSVAGLLLVLTLGVSQLSHAQGTITFNGAPTIPSGSDVLVQYYAEQGMIFTPINSPSPGFVRQGGGTPVYPENGSVYLQAGGGSTLKFGFNGGSLFGLLSVEMAGYSTVVPDFSVDFIGYRTNGSTITTNFSGSGINFRTFAFGTDWSGGLSRVEIPSYAWSLDNLKYQIPEPSFLSLILAASALHALRRAVPTASRGPGTP